MCLHNGILLGHKEEQRTNAFYNADGPKTFMLYN